MWQLTFRCGLFSLDATAQSYLLQKKGGEKRYIGLLLPAKANKGLSGEKNIIIPPLAVWTLFEYVHVSKKRQTAEVSPQTVF